MRLIFRKSINVDILYNVDTINSFVTLNIKPTCWYLYSSSFPFNFYLSVSRSSQIANINYSLVFIAECLSIVKAEIATDGKNIKNMAEVKNITMQSLLFSLWIYRLLHLNTTIIYSLFTTEAKRQASSFESSSIYNICL